MRIKSRYYTEGVFPRLQEKIDEELQTFPAFREELFDKLYSFFRRYFSESGSIYFRHTPYYQDIYERIYTDDRDVMLFWKTQNLYYVKTDRLFRTMTLNLEDAPDQKFASDASAVERKSFNFDASGLQNKRNNEKRSLIFEYKGKADDETLKFAVQYTEGGKKTKADEILKAIKRYGVAVSEDRLTRSYRLCERQSYVDFFINKNAQAFLEEQFDLWMYQYLFKRESDWTDRRIGEMQALKRVARSIIAFISQFEDELVRIWNKPKFALSSNYVITFDRVFSRSEEAARKLLAHENIDAQIAEWRELGMIDEQFRLESIFRRDEVDAPKTKKKRAKQAETLSFETDAGASENEATEAADALPELSAKYRYLPFDTKHFKSLELEILSLFDNLDEELDGRLIHSENYQALNTLKNKFREQVKCIYIDPPYNTESSPIAYINNYKHSSWLTLVSQSLDSAKQMLSEEGLQIVAIDDVELRFLMVMLDQSFAQENYITCIATLCNPQGRVANKVSKTSEYHLVYAKNIEKVGNLFVDKIENKRNLTPFKRTGTNSRRDKRPLRFYPILEKEGVLSLPTKEEYQALYDRDGKKFNDDFLDQLIQKYEAEGFNVILPKLEDGSYLVWQREYERAKREIASYTYKNGSVYTPGFEQEIPKTCWTASLFANPEYGTELLKNIIKNDEVVLSENTAKSIYTVEQMIKMNDDSFVLDYFAGSGTTAHAAINLNREDGGQRKYMLVEANDYFYTVILPRVKKVVFSDKWKDGKAKEGGKGASHFCKYFALEQYEETLRRASYVNDSETEQPAFFDNPYESPFTSYVFLRDKKMSDALAADYANNKISVDFSKLYPDIDLAETLSCVKGKFIKSLAAESVTFTDGETIKFNELDYRDILPLVWWDK